MTAGYLHNTINHNQTLKFEKQTRMPNMLKNLMFNPGEDIKKDLQESIMTKD